MNQKSENMATSPVEKYFEAIELFLREWDQNFRDYDFNDYLYDEQEDMVYRMMDKFYTRIRTVRGDIPKELKPKGLPSLRKLRKITCMKIPTSTSQTTKHSSTIHSTRFSKREKNTYRIRKPPHLKTISQKNHKQTFLFLSTV